MKYTGKLGLVTVLAVVLQYGTLLAQDCSLKLQQAQDYYNQGRVELVPEVLDSCLREGFTSDEKIQAYKLIIRSSIFDGRMQEADSLMQLFLKQYPEYELTEADAVDFSYLFNLYDVRPLASVGLHGGLQRTYLRGSEGHLTSGLGTGGEYSGYMTIRLGLNSLVYLNDRFDLGVDLDFSSVNITYQEPYMSFAKISYEEQISRLEMPIQLIYKHRSYGKFTPYGYLGAGLTYLLSSSATVVLSPTDLNLGSERTGPSLDRTEDRHLVDFFTGIGAGFRYKLPKSFFFVQIDYRLGMTNQFKDEGYTEGDLEWYYYYTDDQFRLSNASISVGFQYNIYKPIKQPETP